MDSDDSRATPRSEAPDPDEARATAGDAARRDSTDAWSAFGTLTSGVLVWGGIGWLLANWVDVPALIPVGLLLGFGAALYLVWLRYGRQ